MPVHKVTSPRARSGARRLALLAGVLALALGGAAPALAAPPSNDSFASPFNVDLNGGAVTLPSTAEATWEAGEPVTPGGSGTCDGRTMLATTWYRVLGNGGVVSVDTTGSSFDTVMAVYLAPNPSLATGVVCNDDAAAGVRTSAVSFQSEAGRAYLVQVGGCNACGTASTGSLVMHVSATEPPPPPAPPPPPPPPPVVITPPPPPDADADGIPDNGADRCPGVKPTRDVDKDGCQDKPGRILSDLTYDFRYLRRGGRIRGITLSRVQLTRAPKGAKVRVSCPRCRRARSGRLRALRSFSFTARRTGTQSVGRLSRVELPRRAKLTVVVTRSGRLGRRIVVTMGSRRDVVKLSCLAVGSTRTRVPCSSGS